VSAQINDRQRRQPPLGIIETTFVREALQNLGQDQVADGFSACAVTDPLK
jgi:hypothetical protein